VSQRSRPISLPELSILSFDPTAEAADKKKGAAGEAARPVGETMLDSITRRLEAPQEAKQIVGRGDGLDRAHNHAAEWLKRNLARGRDGTFSEEFVITPQMAEAMLKKNPDNRHLKKARIAEIRSDLEGGRYVLNGEPIIVSKDGFLNDGQHRLIACVQSGVTFRSFVVFGVTRKSRLTVDQGVARTAADYLDMKAEVKDTKVAATVARMLWQFENTNSINNFGVRKGANVWPTKAQILDVAAMHETDIAKHIDAVRSCPRYIGSMSFVVLCRLLLNRACPTLGSVFVDRLVDGASLSASSPIFILRQRFLNDPKMRQPQRFEAVIRAWNAMRKGTELTQITITGKVPAIEG
jgi:hypothetical protein